MTKHTVLGLALHTLLGLTLLLAIVQTAFASDWRYCLAPSHAERKIYISPPFAAVVSMDNAESQFGRRLAASGLHFDDVQCPRSKDQTGALTMQQHAIVINRELGNEIINVRWKPAG
jgi:hypothetical protein